MPAKKKVPPVQQPAPVQEPAQVDQPAQVDELGTDNQPAEAGLDAAIKEAHRVAKTHYAKSDDTWTKTQINNASKATSAKLNTSDFRKLAFRQGAANKFPELSSEEKDKDKPAVKASDNDDEQEQDDDTEKKIASADLSKHF